MELGPTVVSALNERTGIAFSIALFKGEAPEQNPKNLIIAITRKS